MDLASGRVIEFLENQRFITAAIRGRKNNRYHCLTERGKEVNISRARLIHVSTQKVSGDRLSVLKELKNINKLRQKLTSRIDIPELWEIIIDEQEIWSARELAGLSFSEDITPDHEASIIRAVIADHTYFKFRDGLIHVMPRLVVERLLEQRAREAERLKKLVAGGRWLERLWRGEEYGSNVREADREYWINAIKDVCLKGDESRFYQEVNSLFRQAGIDGKVSLFDTMVKVGVWEEDENLEILRNEVDPEFPPEVMEQADRLAESPEENIFEDGREDLTDLEVFTIDSIESRDLDDAISFEKIPNGYEIGVHITDIGLQIQPDSPLFKDAISRATTIYLPERQIPMLPERLSHGAWSLYQGELRRAVSYLITVDNSGQIQAAQIVPSIIKITKRLSYQDVDGSIGPHDRWYELYKICKARLSHRISSGALPLPIPELNISVDSHGQVFVNLVTPGPARFLVAESMILANQVAARFLSINRIPGLFRSQPPPRNKIISGTETALLPNIRQRRLISRGYLGPEPEPHSGLGLPFYTTITSPLRRAVDLVVQQQISSFLIKGRPLHAREDIDALLPILKQGLRTASRVNQGTVRYWLIKSFAGRKAEVLKAWIIEAGQRRLTAVLQDTLTTFELPVPRGMEVRPDQEIEVRVKEAKPRENILRFYWADV